MKTVLSHSGWEYEIIFRLAGFKRKEDILGNIGNISFQKEIKIDGITFRRNEDAARSFLNPSEKFLFAKVPVTATDDRSAGFKAKEDLEEILDLIRFEMEWGVVSISKPFLAIRPKEQKASLFSFPYQIPNPRKSIREREFRDFLDMTRTILEASKIKLESRKKIKSALRYYRMGSDSDEFENKFLNWWTALEYLLREGDKGSIIEQVEKRLVTTLLLIYTTKHLDSIQSTLTFCKQGDYLDLSRKDMFLLLRDAGKYKRIQSDLIDYPVVAFYLDWFQKNTKDPNSLKDYLARHEERLRWHINRIWRVRCDIVHSAEYSINLTLLSANLEYYLKSLLLIILNHLKRNPTIESLGEFFERNEFSCENLKNDLQNGNEDSLFEILNEEIF